MLAKMIKYGFVYRDRKTGEEVTPTPEQKLLVSLYGAEAEVSWICTKVVKETKEVKMNRTKKEWMKMYDEYMSGDWDELEVKND